MSAAGRIRADVAVVGSGPNGLAAALLCARSGRRVVVLEEQESIGGGCRTVPLPDLLSGADRERALSSGHWDGLVVDPCSAVHPMAGASPFFREFDLAAHGVEMVTPPVQLGHALPGRDAIVVPTDPAPGALAAGFGSVREAAAWWSLMGALARRPVEVAAAALSDQRSVPSPAATAALAGAFVRAHPRGALPDSLGTDGRTLMSGIAAHAITPLGSPAATAAGLVLGSLLHAPPGLGPSGGWERRAHGRTRRRTARCRRGDPNRRPHRWPGRTRRPARRVHHLAARTGLDPAGVLALARHGPTRSPSQPRPHGRRGGQG